jgi:hypothetical protein
MAVVMLDYWAIRSDSIMLVRGSFEDRRSAPRICSSCMSGSAAEKVAARRKRKSRIAARPRYWQKSVIARTVQP